MANDDKVVALVPAPTFKQEIQQDVVSLLNDALALAKEGKILDVVIIASYVDGDWLDWQSATDGVSDVVGRLEIAKQSRIKKLLDERT